MREERAGGHVNLMILPPSMTWEIEVIVGYNKLRLGKSEVEH